MDLFTVPNDKKEILPDGTVIIHLSSNGKYTVTIKNNVLKVEQSGALNKINRGLVGEKLYNLDSVTGTQIKEPGMTTGYFVIQSPGTPDIRGGVQKAVKDENSILFTQSETDLIHQIKDYIEYYMMNKQAPNVAPAQTEQIIFTTNATPIQPKPQVATTTQAPVQTHATEKSKPERKGCLFYLKIVGIVIGAFILLFLLFSCFSGSSNDTANQDQPIVEETPQVDNSAMYQSYADQAKAYYNELTQIANQLAADGNVTMDQVTTEYNNLADRIIATETEIPEDTTDQTLRIERAMFDQLAKIATLPMAYDLTGASIDEFRQTLDKNVAEYKTLTEQIPEYYQAD